MHGNKVNYEGVSSPRANLRKNRVCQRNLPSDSSIRNTTNFKRGNSPYKSMIWHSKLHKTETRCSMSALEKLATSVTEEMKCNCSTKYHTTQKKKGNHVSKK